MDCKNCQNSLSQKDDYCNVCGAKVIRNRLTVKNLWADFAEQFLNYDNKFLKTYLALFKKPEDVIGSYINGTRKKYVNVISYFAIAVTLSGIQLFILRKFYPEVMDLTVLMPGNVPEGYSNFDWIYDYYSFISLINLPLYAFIAYLVFKTLKKLNFTEHLVTMTYIVAQYSITSAVVITLLGIIGVNFYIAGSIFNLGLIIYTAICYKRLLKLSTEGIILRTLLFIGIIMVALLIQGIIQAYFMYKSGAFEKIIEAEKAKRGVSYIASSFINWTS
ncbi:DUF3667 domain-containing protein [Aureisphaera sp. CAU 1614]|uniref:DUF3667 domain-containing protein n=1 Tax=Halomarinibacterium sedimenti TaxID=2857106 RepID=A0A9X1FL25_9FLAO|nr:DUF3667 domain-containing protein [Halomarinibacterium sedimenti]MBW2936550.1 DUF3667 domain-containing protein [Halomarinibacterium sedimenti]